MGAFAERTPIGERQREGIALAKARGVYHGRKRSLTGNQLRQRAGSGEEETALAREYGISRVTSLLRSAT